MKQNTLTQIIEEQTNRALWEIRNVIDCVPEDLWNRKYCEMPCWKHIYFRFDRWTIIRISSGMRVL